VSRIALARAEEIAMPGARLSQTRFWALIGIVLTLAPKIATAQEVEDARARAVRLAAEGTAAYKAEDYPGAIKKFAAAYQTFPAPPLLLNLSRAELKLSRCREAIRDAELFKAAVPDTRSTSEDSPDEWLATIQRTCIEAEVHTTPEGASIWIDGERQAAPDKTPWTGRLPVGSHKVLLFFPGLGKRERYLDVSADAPAYLTIPFPGATAPPPPTALPQVIAVASSTPATQPAAAKPPETKAAPPTPVSVAPPPAESHASTPASPPAVERQVNLTPPPALPTHAVSTAATRPALVQRKIGYVAVAVGGAALVAATILGVTVQSEGAGLNKAPVMRTTTQANSQLSSLDSREYAADTLFAIGGLLAAGGVALAVVF
jgi:hypothetical protein